jgi:hypothetical protein
MLGLLESQRDHAMGIVAAMAKENAELKSRMLDAPEPEQEHDDAV